MKNVQGGAMGIIVYLDQLLYEKLPKEGHLSLEML